MLGIQPLIAASTMPIHARDQTSYIPVYMLAGALALEVLRVLALEEWTESRLVIMLLLALATLATWWIKAVQSHRRTEINPQTRQVTTHAVTAGFSPIKNHYPLDQFCEVRSYTTIGRFPKNHVELVMKSGGRALIVATFTPSVESRSFWSIPKESESAMAMQLRKEIASRCGFTDRGFLGSRLTGALIET